MNIVIKIILILIIMNLLRVSYLMIETNPLLGFGNLLIALLLYILILYNQ